MEIRSISEKIFRTSPSKTENSKCNQTNPFGVSFRGNVVSADVFECATKKSNIIEKVSNRSKMVMSAIVGSVNSASQVISSRFNSILSFGNRMHEGVKKAWNGMKSHMETLGSKSKEMIKNDWLDRFCENRSVKELSSMFEEVIAARAARAEEVA